MTKVIRPEPAAGTEPEINVTPEMIEAGEAAMRTGLGDEFPYHSITNDLTVADIYRAMRSKEPR